MSGTVLRTPDAAFDRLPDFPYTPRYLDDLASQPGLRVAYVDEGPADADQVFLCVHGQPTWSYLYRKMIPPFLSVGGRVVAPDLLGFGRSDKPAEDRTYTFDFHRSMLIALVERLDLHSVTLVVQDWGGLLGLTLPVEPAIRRRISRLLVMNTALAVGEDLGPGFAAWRDYAGSTDDMPVGPLLKRSQPGLTDAEAAAYDAPFPDRSYKAGVRAFPKLVMTHPDMPGVEVSRLAQRFWQHEWNGPTFMACGAQDPVFGPEYMRGLAQGIAGCPPPFVVDDAGHFCQERGDVIADAALSWFSRVDSGGPAPA